MFGVIAVAVLAHNLCPLKQLSVRLVVKVLARLINIVFLSFSNVLVGSGRRGAGKFSRNRKNVMRKTTLSQAP